MDLQLVTLRSIPQHTTPITHCSFLNSLGHSALHFVNTRTHLTTNMTVTPSRSDNNNSGSNNNNNKWRSHKEDGKNYFRQEKFEEALTSYRAALLTAPDATEKQILLSNIVACRLKIGGPAMAAAAVEEAKQVRS